MAPFNNHRGSPPDSQGPHNEESPPADVGHCREKSPPPDRSIGLIIQDMVQLGPEKSVMRCYKSVNFTPAME